MVAAVIENETVINIIVADAATDTPPEGTTLVNIDDETGVVIGSTYADGVFTNPPPPVVAAPVPQSVTPRQVRLLLLQQGLLDEVEAMIAASDKATQITWQYASTFNRNDPLLDALATNLGLTSQQIDQFFAAAAAL